MAKAFLFLAPGFEDIEALTPVDVLRRGGIDVTTVSITPGDTTVLSAHGIPVVADALFDDCDLSDADALILPGGMPGASNLYAHEGLRQAITRHAARHGLLAAICAAPAVVLGQMGLLRGHRATCYPGFEQLLDGATYTGDVCTVDGDIVTAEGPAAALAFSYQLLAMLADEATAHQVSEGMRYLHLSDTIKKL